MRKKGGRHIEQFRKLGFGVGKPRLLREPLAEFLKERTIPCPEVPYWKTMSYATEVSTCDRRVASI